MSMIPARPLRALIVPSLFIGGFLFVIISTTIPSFPQTKDEKTYAAISESFCQWAHLVWQEWRDGRIRAPFRLEIIQHYWDIDHEHPSLFKILSAVSLKCFSPWVSRLTALRLGTAIFWTLFAMVLFYVLCQQGSMVFAGIAVLGMVLLPRHFGFVHLAEITIHLSWLWNIILLIVYRSIRGCASWRWGGWCVSGLLWGLAVAAKVTGVLLAPVVFCFALVWRYPYVLRAVCVWMVCGMLSFLISWPQLWYEGFGFFTDHVAHFDTLNKTVSTLYAGQEYEVLPWHYPWVMFMITMPVYVLAFFIGGCVLVVKRHDALGCLGLLNFVIVISALSCYTAYPGDGIRHFIMIYPLCFYISLYGLWHSSAFFFGQCLHLSSHHIGRLQKIAACVFLVAVCAENIIVFPQHFQYYSSLVGGTQGALKKGFMQQYYR